MRPIPLILLLFSAQALAAEVERPQHSAVLPEEALATEGVALARLGYRLELVPAPWRFVRRDGFTALAKSGWGVVVEPAGARNFAKSLRSYATEARCRIVVRGEGGLPLDDADALASIGPCFFEVHVASDPEPWAKPFSCLRPASIVWEAGTEVPPAQALARFAKLPQPVLAVADEAAVGAADVLEKLGDDRLGLRIHAKSGQISPATQKALKRPGRTFRVTVVAQDGLDAKAARELRDLPDVAVELSLERPAPRTGLLEAAGVLSRPVDQLDQRRLTDEEADAPLLHPR